MTQDQYFNNHLPHRMNLLTTFRDRYAPNPKRPGFQSGEPRDLFRCSKDISMLMVRFFCSEMGLSLKYKATELEEKRDWKYPNGIQQFTENEAKNDNRYEGLLAVMKAANRAVAHLESSDVDHAIQTEADQQMLFDIIAWIETLVESHIYAPTGRSLKDSMALPNNIM